MENKSGSTGAGDLFIVVVKGIVPDDAAGEYTVAEGAVAAYQTRAEAEVRADAENKKPEALVVEDTPDAKYTYEVWTCPRG
jgi:hypothetical protein